MGARHQPPPELAGIAFAGREVDGAVTRRQLASPAYERLCQGAYRVALGADAGSVPYAQRVQALLAVLPAHAVLVGRSAAWAGGRWEPLPTDPVEVNVSPSGSIKKRAGLRRSARLIPEADVVLTARGRATYALRTALDVACYDPFEVAVPVLDAIMHTTSLRQSDLLAALAASPEGRRGRRRARIAIAASDDRAESPRESLLRLLVVAAGLPEPKVAWEVPFDDDKLYLDLAWPDVKVALEYDGWPHHDERRRSRDLARHNALRAVGWIVIQVDAAGFRHPEVFMAHLAAALSR